MTFDKNSQSPPSCAFGARELRGLSLVETCQRYPFGEKSKSVLSLVSRKDTGILFLTTQVCVQDLCSKQDFIGSYSKEEFPFQTFVQLGIGIASKRASTPSCFGAALKCSRSLLESMCTRGIEEKTSLGTFPCLLNQHIIISLLSQPR